MSVYDRRIEQEVLAFSFQEVTRRVSSGTSPQVAVVEVVKDILQRHAVTLTHAEYTKWCNYLLAVAETQAKKRLVPRAISYAPVVLGRDVQAGNILSIPPQSLASSALALGRIGTGKSSGVHVPIALQLASMGLGFCLIDPHRKTIEDVLARLPENRRADVLFIEPGRMTHRVGINPLSRTRSTSLNEKRDADVDRLMDIFKRLWFDDMWGQRMENLLRAFIIAALHNNLTLAELPYFFNNKEFRKRVYANVPDSFGDHYTRYYFENEFEKQPPAIQSQWATPILNRAYQLLMIDEVLDMLRQERTTLDFAQLMDEQKIILIHLSDNLIGSDAKRFLGTIFIAEIIRAAFSRTPGASPLFTVLIDEFPDFAFAEFTRALAQLRKFNVGFVLACQTLNQIKDKELLGVVKQLETQIIFACTPEDAKAEAIDFARSPEPTYQEREKKVITVRPVDFVLGGTHAHEDVRVNAFFALWMEEYRLNRESKGNETIGGGTSAVYKGRAGYKEVIRDARPNPHYHQVGSAREEIGKLNQFAYEAMTTNPHVVFPLSLLFHMIDAYEAPCFDRKAYTDWLKEYSKFPPLDYCTFLRELMREDGSDIIYGSIFNNTQRVKTRPNAYLLSEFERVYTRFFTATNEQELLRAFGEYEKLVLEILKKDLLDQYPLFGWMFTVYHAENNLKEKYTAEIRRSFGEHADRLLAVPMEQVTFEITKYDIYDQWCCKAFPQAPRFALVQEQVDRVITTGKESFEHIIREIREVSRLLAASPIMTGSGIMEQVETGHVTQQEMISRMEKELVSLPKRTAYVRLGTSEAQDAPKIETIPLPNGVSAQELQARLRTVAEQTRAYGTAKEDIERQVQERRVRFGLASPIGTEREKKTPEKEAAPAVSSPAGQTTTRADRVVEAGTSEPHPLSRLSENITPDTYLELLYYFSHLTIKQIAALLQREDKTKAVQYEVNKLIGAGLVETVEAEHTKFLATGGRAPLVYRLSAKGYEKLLKEKKRKPLSLGGFSQHSYKVNEVLLALLQGCEEASVTLVDFCHEKQFRSLHLIKLDGGKELEPDALLCLQVNKHVQNVFLECDLKSESSGKLKDKIRRYCQAIERKAHQGFETGTSTIAFITPQGKDADTDRLLRITQEAIQPKYATHFLVASLNIDEIAPVDLLTANLFRKPFETTLYPLLQNR